MSTCKSNHKYKWKAILKFNLGAGAQQHQNGASKKDVVVTAKNSLDQHQAALRNSNVSSDASRSVVSRII